MEREKTIEAMADAIDAARYRHPDHPRERPWPFCNAHKTDHEYAFRLARAAFAALPAQEWQDISTDMRSFDTRGTKLTRSGRVLLITCVDDATANQVVDQLRTRPVAVTAGKLGTE